MFITSMSYRTDPKYPRYKFYADGTIYDKKTRCLVPLIRCNNTTAISLLNNEGFIESRNWVILMQGVYGEGWKFNGYNTK